MNRKLKTTMLLIVILIITMGTMSGCGNSAETDQAQEEMYTPVEIDEVAVGTVENKIKINGKVVANEEIAVIPKAMGIVTKVNVKLGDLVDEGSTLFTIEQDDIAKKCRAGI